MLDHPVYFSPIKKLNGGWIANKSAPDPPPAPDYTAAAEKTAQGNMDMARYTTTANRISQYNPWGSLTYQNYTDPQGNDHWSQTQTLDPGLQQALDSQIKVQAGRSDTAAQLLDKANYNFTHDNGTPQLGDYLNGLQGLDQNARTTDQYTQGLPSQDTTRLNVGDYTSGAQALDQNAPQMSDQVRQEAQNAAYNSANSFLAPQYQQQEQNLRDSLALQGLNPMSQASGQATKSFYDSKNQAYNQLANQAVLTGDQMANTDYASKLAGFNASNAARQQVFNNGLQSYGADLSGLNSSNAAKQANYGNALAAQGQDLNAIAQSNQARQQAYQNALQKYQTEYQAYDNAINRPLNQMNALLTGQQVSQPTFNGYAMQNQVQGPDYSGAANQLANYNQGVYNSQAAGASSSNAGTMGAIGSIAGAAAMMF